MKIETIVASALFTAACAANHNVGAPPKAGPEVTFTIDEGDDGVPADYECAAQAPSKDDVQLNQAEDSISRVDITLGRHALTERAVFDDGREMVARLGGCAHYGASFEFTIEDPTPASNNAHYIARIMQLLKSAPLNNRAGWAQDIIEAVEKNPDGVDECSFTVQEGYSHVFCQFNRSEEGRMNLQITYDIEL